LKHSKTLFISELSVVVASLLLAASALAEPPSQAISGPESTLSTSAGTPRRGEKVIAGLELRPSWTSRIGEVHTEDYVQFGYQFNPNFQVFYRQEFTTNLFNPGSSAQGMGVYAYDGSLRTKVANLVTFNRDLALHYEARLWLPTFSVRRNAGMIVGLRQALRLKQELGPYMAVSLEEIAVPHIWSRPGNDIPSAPEANPAYENRVYLTFDWKPTSKVKFSVPFILTSIRYRDYQPKARNNDSWGHKVWLYPELTYAVNPNITVGLAYYSDNLVLSNFGGTQVATGLEKGISQLILNASL